MLMEEQRENLGYIVCPGFVILPRMSMAFQSQFGEE